MENLLTEFVRPELLILIPVLFFIGKWLKAMPDFNTKHIPVALGVISISFCIIETLAASNIADYHDALKAVFTALTQGLLCAGCSVYAHQITKQYSQSTEQADTTTAAKAA